MKNNSEVNQPCQGVAGGFRRSPKMRYFLIILVVIASGHSIATAEELWHDGKITPDQPFKAKVIGVKPGWGWDTIVLKEIGGKGRYCFASVGHKIPSYEIIAAEDFDKKAMLKTNTTFIEPAADVGRFAWCMGVWKHGRIFGDEDTATKYYKKGEQDGADQPATVPESKSEGDDKPKPESEGRPQ